MTRPLDEELEGLPKNWGRWGHADEVGALNHIGPREVLAAAQEIRSGEVFTLGARIAGPGNEPVWPGRDHATRHHVQDSSSYASGEIEPLAGGLKYADDSITMFLQGTTHFDGLGHTWYGDALYNGYDAATTDGEMHKAGVLPIAERGVVGRGVLIDMAGHRGKSYLERGEAFELSDVLAAAEEQQVDFRTGDILLIHTGWIDRFYVDPTDFNTLPFAEPGLLYTHEVSDWFRDTGIATFGTDTISNEFQPQPDSGIMSVLHGALMRDLGIAFNEILSLTELARACAVDRRYAFFYSAGPLKVVGATGSPVNPVAIR